MVKVTQNDTHTHESLYIFNIYNLAVLGNKCTPMKLLPQSVSLFQKCLSMAAYRMESGGDWGMCGGWGRGTVKVTVIGM